MIDESKENVSSSVPVTDGEGNINYFAIGSMMNPVSVAARNLTPLSSMPAVLPNFRIGFFSSLGFAVPVPAPGSSMHGVIHSMSSEDMRLLDIGELAVHDRISAPAHLYDGTSVQVSLYTRKGNSDENSSKEHESDKITDISNAVGEDNDSESLPHERYLDIMIEGCIHHGVDSEYVEHLRSLPTVPRTLRENYETFGEPPEGQFLTMDEVLFNNGSDGRPLYLVFRNKVISTPKDIDVRTNPRCSFLYTMTQKLGQIGELVVGRIAYEPKFGVPNSLADVTPEHAEYCEDSFCSFTKTTGIRDMFHPIAYLRS